MDRITQSLLNEFVRLNSLDELSPSDQFEHFTGYLTTSVHHTESFETSDIVVGGGGDSGFDTVSFIVNGQLVTEPEDVKELLQLNGFLEVTIIFVQAETSSSFDSAKIGQFAFGVKDFLSEKPKLPRNSNIVGAGALLQTIFDNAVKFRKGKPACYLYYATTGKWSADANLETRRKAEQQDLEDLNLFRSVKFECIGADRLHRLYNDSKNSIAREVVFSEKTVLPEIPGVDQAYIGILSGPEFLKLIQNEDGEIITSIFYDNVRDWQDWNAVNTEIKGTLASAGSRVRFALLNNGVTIVARKVQPTGNRFHIEDYQVVNGCQTSYVLHECAAEIDSDVQVPVRLIATDDEDLKNAIIKATNRQTPVAPEHLFALSDFPKQLERYFPTFPGKQVLYYERRSRQYHSRTDIEKVRIINQTTLIRSFASMFAAKPHAATRSYRSLRDGLGTAIFAKDHKLEPYYTAAFAHYRMEFFFRNGVLKPEWKPGRYQILLALRLDVIPNATVSLSANETGRLCHKLNEILWDDAKAKAAFQKAARTVAALAKEKLEGDELRLESFTKEIVKHMVQQVPKKGGKRN